MHLRGNDRFRPSSVFPVELNGMFVDVDCRLMSPRSWRNGGLDWNFIWGRLEWIICYLELFISGEDSRAQKMDSGFPRSIKYHWSNRVERHWNKNELKNVSNFKSTISRVFLNSSLLGWIWLTVEWRRRKIWSNIRNSSEEGTMDEMIRVDCYTYYFISSPLVEFE